MANTRDEIDIKNRVKISVIFFLSKNVLRIKIIPKQACFVGIK